MIEINGQGVTIGKKNASIKDKVNLNVLRLNPFFDIIFKQYPISATPLACL
jgi:hypothetical protein